VYGGCISVYQRLHLSSSGSALAQSIHAQDHLLVRRLFAGVAFELQRTHIANQTKQLPRLAVLTGDAEAGLGVTYRCLQYSTERS
jgi:hypothetical protein